MALTTKLFPGKGLTVDKLPGTTVYRSLKHALNDVNKNLEEIHLKSHKQIVGKQPPINAGTRDHSEMGLGGLKGMNMSAGMGNVPGMHVRHNNNLTGFFK